jgi:hypothetical protein
MFRIAPRGLVRLDVGVGHAAEGRDGVDRLHDFGAALLGEGIGAIHNHALAERRVLLARLGQRQIGERPERRLALLAADPVAIDEIRSPPADHAKVEASAVAMAAGFFDQASERGLCELWHVRPQCPRFCPRFLIACPDIFGHTRARQVTVLRRIA